MRIGEVSSVLGIRRSAIRFYERQGLLESNRINRAPNGYRMYSPQDVERIQLVLKFKEFGLELDEIRLLLNEASKSCDDLIHSLDEQLYKCRQMEVLIKKRIASLVSAKNRCRAECKPDKKVTRCCATSL